MQTMLEVIGRAALRARLQSHTVRAAIVAVEQHRHAWACPKCAAGRVCRASSKLEGALTDALAGKPRGALCAACGFGGGFHDQGCAADRQHRQHAEREREHTMAVRAAGEEVAL